jgi:hypothetical protein
MVIFIEQRDDLLEFAFVEPKSVATATAVEHDFVISSDSDQFHAFAADWALTIAPFGMLVEAELSQECFNGWFVFEEQFQLP